MFDLMELVCQSFCDYGLYYLKILCPPGWCQDHTMVDDGCFGGQFLVLTTIRFVMESEQARYSQSCLLSAK